MINKQTVNLTSLNLIQSELMSTIDTAAMHLETFISERDNTKVLHDCIESLQQIRGSLDLVQLHGACELAGEILSAASGINIGTERKLENKLAALTKGFFVLSCYFEYTQQNKIGMPILLVPYINDIRLSNGRKVIPECYFEADITPYTIPPGEKTTDHLEDSEFTSMARRFRHMYQVGLLGFIKETTVKQSLEMMHRAIGKIRHLSQGTKSETFWWLAHHSIGAFAQADIYPNAARKQLFRQLDKHLRSLEKQGMGEFEYPVPDSLLKELVFYIAITDTQEEESQDIKQLFGFDTIEYTEKTLQQEAASLTGPSVNTVQSVADVLRIELNIIKENIENANVSNDLAAHYADTIPRVQKIKEILSIVGLTTAADILSAPLTALSSSQAANTEMSQGEVLSLADAFIYLESVLSSLEKRSFSAEKLTEINQLNQNELISANHLQNAQLVVIEQIGLGLSTIKNGLTAFADSSYDKVHIKDIPAILSELRGGMIVLALPRVAAIITSCSHFIEQTLMSTDEPAALEHMLETFADALICLEYYLNCMQTDKNVNADTLTVAEESLEALGYAVKDA